MSYNTVKKKFHKQGHFFKSTSIIFLEIYDGSNTVLRHAIGMMVRVFANGPGDLGSITDQVIPKTQKMVLDALTLSIIRYVSRVKWDNQGRGVVPSPTPWWSSYQKGEP